MKDPIEREHAMNLIIKPRQSGRTTELINRCASYRYALIVCPTRKQAEYVFKMAIDSKMDIPMPITFREFVDGRFYAPNINAFLFDNLDGCLEAYSRGVKIDSVVFEEGRVDIEKLPSAQPEIIHCAECIHWKHAAIRKYCDVFDWISKAEDFCSFAERRTDGNGRD